MLLLWTTTKLGKIWLDGDAIRQIVAKRLPSDLYVQDVALIGESSRLEITIAVPEDTDPDVKTALEEKLSALFARACMTVSIKWLTTAPQDNKKKTPVWTLPLFWAGAAAALTSIYHMGIGGILWAIFTAVVAYGISWIVITEDGQKQLSALK